MTLVQTLRTPGLQRSRLLRNLLATALLVAAAAMLVISMLTPTPQVVVYSKDLSPGHELTDDDLNTVRLSSSSNAGLITNSADLTGKRLAVGRPAGALAYQDDIVGDHFSLTETIDNAVAIPIDPLFSDLIFIGTTLDIFASDEFGQVTMVAERATVVWADGERALVQVPKEQVADLSSALTTKAISLSLNYSN